MVHAPVKTKSPRRGRVVAIVLSIVVVIAVLGFIVWRAIHGDLPSDAEKSEQIARLEATVLPVIEDLKIEYFMDESGRANLTYPRGDFIDGDCSGSSDNPAPFDDIARADHERIKAALEASGTPIERVGGRFFGDGRVRDAWFMSDKGAPFATSWSLEFDPEGTRSAGRQGIVTLTPVEGEDELVVRLLRGLTTAST